MMDLLEIGPVNACEMALKNDEVENFSIELRCYRTRKERKVFEACGKKIKTRFKTAFKSKETAERMRSDIRISGCPVYTCPKSTGTSG